MPTGAITSSVDVAQLVLYAFWIFFAALVYYLVRENHREGYPMVTESGRGVITGWPIPDPKTYRLRDGSTVSVPTGEIPPQQYSAEPAHRWAGAPIVPTGDPMTAGVGPGAWAQRGDHPDLDFEGQPKVAPMRVSPGYGVDAGDIDPRGLPALGADGVAGGTVVDLWVDRSENLFRYLEVELADRSRRVLIPMNFARVRRNGVEVKAILGAHFAGVPATRLPEVATMLEEEKIQAYYGAGTLYAEAGRAEPLL